MLLLSHLVGQILQNQVIKQLNSHWQFNGSHHFFYFLFFIKNVFILNLSWGLSQTWGYSCLNCRISTEPVWYMVKKKIKIKRYIKFVKKNINSWTNWNVWWILEPWNIMKIRLQNRPLILYLSLDSFNFVATIGYIVCTT